MTKNALILHHSSDLDGYGSAVVALKFLKEQNDYIDSIQIPVNYNSYDFKSIQNTIYNLQKLGEVWIFVLDFSFEEKEMEWLIEKSSKLFWCDHHPTIQKRVNNIREKLITKNIDIFNNFNQYGEQKLFFNFDFNNKQAAIALTWYLLFSNEPIPTFIKHINNADLWKFDDPKTIYFKEFVYSLEWKNYKFLTDLLFNNYLTERFNNEEYSLEYIIDDIGKLLSKSKKRQIKSKQKHFIKGYIENYSACIINNTNNEINSDVLNYMCKEHNFDISLSYFDDLVNNKKIFSIRSIKENIDVGLIAKKFNGGGHKKAAGFSLSLSDGNIFLQKFTSGEL